MFTFETKPFGKKFQRCEENYSPLSDIMDINTHEVLPYHKYITCNYFMLNGQSYLTENGLILASFDNHKNIILLFARPSLTYDEVHIYHLPYSFYKFYILRQTIGPLVVYFYVLEISTFSNKFCKVLLHAIEPKHFSL